jgi:predicted aspartyl protease
MRAKALFFAWILVIVYQHSAFAQQKHVEDSFAHIITLFGQNNYFEADDEYKLLQSTLTGKQQQYCQAVLSNAFNRTAESQNSINQLLAGRNDFADSLVYRLLQVKQDNALKMYNYRVAGETARTILSDFSQFLSEEQKSDCSNDVTLWSALSDIAPQSVEMKGSVTLPIIKDLAGLNTLQIRQENDSLNFIFDTGANLSTTTDSIAELLQMQILPVRIQVGAITGQKVDAKLAVCDHLQLGSISFQQVVFLVLPNEALSFPQINYHIYGILGFPVIEALGEIQITADNRFNVPEEKGLGNHTANLAMHNLTPLIRIGKHHYTFDTGAESSMLYQAFYLENKETIDHQYPVETLSFGGAGGVSTAQGFRINQTFDMAGKSVSLQNVYLFRDKIREDETVYGNIGQDIIRQFSKMTINFRQMYIAFE